MSTLVRIPGRRWVVEESFHSAKELASLDEHQVRGWTSWHRWTVVSMLPTPTCVTVATERADPSTTGLIC